MKTNKLWIAVLLLMILHFVIQFTYFKSDNTTDINDTAIFIADLAGSIISIVLLGLVPALLISIIPFKQKTYKEKLSVAAPVCFLVNMIILVANFSYLAYLQDIKGIKLTP